MDVVLYLSSIFLVFTKAIFHFRTIRLETDGSLPEQDKLKDAVIDDTRTLGTGPFELLIGREFKLSVLEKMVKEMLLGEVARFSCPYEVCMYSTCLHVALALMRYVCMYSTCLHVALALMRYVCTLHVYNLK